MLDRFWQDKSASCVPAVATAEYMHRAKEQCWIGFSTVSSAGALIVATRVAAAFMLLAGATTTGRLRWQILPRDRIASQQCASP
jgi:hypothetical protein